EPRKDMEAAEQEITELRRAVERLSLREKELRQMLLETHERLLSRDEEYQALSATQNYTATHGVPAPRTESVSLSAKMWEYRHLVRRVQEVVRSTLPAGATVIVV